MEPLQQCDCGRLTVMRQDNVPTCMRCQEVSRAKAQTWIGQVPEFEMDKIVQLAIQRAEGPNGLLTSISCRQIIKAFEHDQALKRAMATQRYEEWRAANPIISKEQLIHGR